jgi:hypothetical protein
MHESLAKSCVGNPGMATKARAWRWCYLSSAVYRGCVEGDGPILKVDVHVGYSTLYHSRMEIHRNSRGATGSGSGLYLIDEQDRGSLAVHSTVFIKLSLSSECAFRSTINPNTMGDIGQSRIITPIYNATVVLERQTQVSNKNKNSMEHIGVFVGPSPSGLLL